MKTMAAAIFLSIMARYSAIAVTNDSFMPAPFTPAIGVEDAHPSIGLSEYAIRINSITKWTLIKMDNIWALLSEDKTVKPFAYAISVGSAPVPSSLPIETDSAGVSFPDESFLVEGTVYYRVDLSLMNPQTGDENHRIIWNKS